MEAMLERCAGLDVHQASVTACALTGSLDAKPAQSVESFGTTTTELIRLRDWLVKHEVSHVAMESTGVYWMPVWQVLEGSFELVLANAQYIRNLPGRKTDVSDAVWLAQLLRSGLVRGSFIPPELFRQLRNYSRYRFKLVGQATAEKNRIQKMLETAGIKLATFLSDVFGVSGRALLQALIEGEVLTEDHVRSLVHTQVKRKVPQLVQALNGFFSLHHRDMIRMHLEHLRFLEQQIEELDARIQQLLQPYEADLELLKSLPGVDETAAAAILAETGPDMSPFPTDAHFASWAGVCPGNNESAGKKKSGKTPKGKKILKATLCQCAWGASSTKDSRTKAYFERIMRRRGKKKANMAVAHLLVRLIYVVLSTKKPYSELGFDYLLGRQSVEDMMVKKLRSLGYNVTKQLTE